MKKDTPEAGEMLITFLTVSAFINGVFGGMIVLIVPFSSPNYIIFSVTIISIGVCIMLAVYWSEKILGIRKRMSKTKRSF